ncbi:uncharacterized protein CLUP02_17203 [Colletotrichum lupini]|uniref:Uncharacterized protein n=1 Tax=Colletotrichum lupini TaxID=145971 RepID=A0A9Q8TB87_9PEZI|nr:uncharacterized protein CLUP02_17203 [Colletotrichum lupini]UQC91667.1 hypothetical protein CLUP02_17203 [Colletotrichum lupini]
MAGGLKSRWPKPIMATVWMNQQAGWILLDSTHTHSGQLAPQLHIFHIPTKSDPGQFGRPPTYKPQASKSPNGKLLRPSQFTYAGETMSIGTLPVQQSSAHALDQYSTYAQSENQDKTNTTQPIMPNKAES